MFSLTPAQWAAYQQTKINVDDQCVNWEGKRDDGSFCRDKAEPNSGWCARCKADFHLEP